MEETIVFKETGRQEDLDFLSFSAPSETSLAHDYDVCKLTAGRRPQRTALVYIGPSYDNDDEEWD